MKIAFLGRYEQSEILNGPEKVAKRLYGEMKNLTNAVFIEYFFDGNKYSLKKKLFGEEIILIDGVTIYRLGIIRIIVFLLKFKPNIAHLITFERFACVAYLIKLFIDVKIVYTVHGIIKYENSQLKRGLSKTLYIKDSLFEKLVYSFSDRIVFLSNLELEMAKRYFRIDDKKIHFIFNGIDEIFFRRYKTRVKKEILNIIAVGNLERTEKGIKFLIDSIMPLNINFRLLVIGSNNNTSVSKCISFVEKVTTEEFSKLLYEADIFISASSYEPFSISTLEAIATGAIPIFSYQTGAAELFTEDIKDFRFSYGDSKKLQEIIKYIWYNFNDVSIRLKTIRNKCFDLRWEKIGEQYLTLYKKMLRPG